ncbi:hypothetical protein PVNG_05845 [Plasmodium vivax North Korean]|uniref:Uncharacterized protein n=1 Tax=Plasmodium vivax North Korean TaxID=1035514 RepID=A0A0J9TP16_PLAVI|nr:hypothetical protein PVNG_05845 [Plasmodium vivax North Korean]
MECYCPKLDEEKNEDNIFSLNCAFKYIYLETRNLDNIGTSYINKIKNIEDPILRHIFIYFVRYYIDGYNYFKGSKQNYRHDACQYLNRWLAERKDLFTYGEMCQTKMKLWEKEIENLWGMLKNEYTIPNKNGKAWCEESSIKLKTTYPSELTSPKCDETISPEPKSAELSSPLVSAECECSKTIDPAIPLPQDQPQEMDRTKNLAVTSGFTAAGTLGTLFFLYRVINKQ